MRSCSILPKSTKGLTKPDSFQHACTHAHKKLHTHTHTHTQVGGAVALLAVRKGMKVVLVDFKLDALIKTKDNIVRAVMYSQSGNTLREYVLQLPRFACAS